MRRIIRSRMSICAVSLTSMMLLEASIGRPSHAQDLTSTQGLTDKKSGGANAGVKYPSPSWHALALDRMRIGHELSYMMNYEAALESMKAAYKMAEDHPDTDLELFKPIMLAYIAFVECKLGRFADAQGDTEKFLKMIDHSPKAASTAHAFSTCSLAYLQMRRHESAETCAKKAISIIESLGDQDTSELETSLNALGTACNKLGRYAEADAHLTRSLSIGDKLRKGMSTSKQVDELINLAESKRGQHKLAEAEEVLKKADESLNDTTSRVGAYQMQIHRSFVVLEHANLLRDRGKFAESEPLYRLAIKLLDGDSRKGPTDLLPMYTEFAILLRRMSRAKEAEAMEQQASAITKLYALMPVK